MCFVHKLVKVGLSESEKRKFWEDLDSMVRAVPTNEKLFIGGDLNGHVGSTKAGQDIKQRWQRIQESEIHIAGDHGSARPWPRWGVGAATPQGLEGGRGSRRKVGGARSGRGRPDFGSGRGGSGGGGSSHAGVEAGWRKAGDGGSGHAGVEARRREAGGGESRRREAGGSRREAGGARSGRVGSDPGGAGAGVADPAMAEGGQPPTVTAPSPHGGGATGKGEEEAAGVEEKTGLAGGGSPAMEAAAAAAGERRGEGGEPSALGVPPKCLARTSNVTPCRSLAIRRAFRHITREGGIAGPTTMTRMTRTHALAIGREDGLSCDASALGGGSLSPPNDGMGGLIWARLSDDNLVGDVNNAMEASATSLTA
ncbi:hypothetical protein GUJ93_ZPchr0009g949 [Zizania palustris]|uniref:Uncharacterized protein n=1 Tax=Zizania palustris TaxID=103762 RepID=A0A8J5UYX7_ZIZPA|nr:hypothetical protein GUJ93_ZPchr0009g949 [Zizania palustris]